MLATTKYSLTSALLVAGALLWGSSCQDKGIVQDYENQGPPKSSQIQVWLSTPDKSALFARQTTRPATSTAGSTHPTITVDTAELFQEIDGFGYTLTGGSTLHLSRMSPGARASILQELFGTDDTNIGVSYLRISIGASDLDERPFSYLDLPAGQTDPQLSGFSLDPDRQHLIPVLKEILAINPDLLIMGSPWSPPAWMKDNGDTRGGSLKPEFYDAYARYFVKYIQGMAEEGIRIDAITVQNEPLHPGNNPSLLMLAPQQADFIKNHLGPAFQAAALDTKIIIYDHNADRPDYPISILNDPQAKQYIDGSAFHLYGGDISALSQVHQAHPDKRIYFTEQWIGAPGDFPADLAWHTRELIIGATRNWSRTVLEWNLAADPNHQPHTDRGGCTSCLGAITIAGNSVTRNPAYYIIAHASKFVRPGSVRISSNMLAGLPNVAFKAPNGDKVLIVLNDTQSSQTFSIALGQGEKVDATLPAGAVATYVWP
ncbi:glycoside hydrolase family 30 protein [Cesiribacter andamanensis]|nr:glycoside hydrolase family 30 beta sandwich domain-containing protein [Cesiribacter andamanensis]